jgi:hypothetical protein
VHGFLSHTLRGWKKWDKSDEKINENNVEKMGMVPRRGLGTQPIS